MKKIWFSLLWLCLLVAFNSASAANLTWSQITGFSTKLDNNRTQLLKNLELSKEKLANTAKENSAITETSLFKAASCLWAISEEDQDLDFNKLISWLQETILNEYIKLDWDIKRLSFWLLNEDPIVFWNSIDSYYNQNAQKITDLENDYYTKATKAKANFLEYVDNNSELLNWLAIKLDAFNAIQKAANDVIKALDQFSWAVKDKSSLLVDLEKAREESEEDFAKQLDSIITESISTYQPNGDIQAQYYIHKDNFVKKYKEEEKKAEYYLFSAIFSYEKYADLLDRKANVDKQFLNSDKNVDCSLLLTTTFNIWSYAKDVASVSESLVKGLNLLTNAVKDWKIDMSILEEPTVVFFKKDTEKLTRKYVKNFKAMLKSISPKVEESTWDVATGAEAPANEVAVTKVTFTQAFKKNQYHEQVKTLQTVLKNWGYYNWEITGVYSPATIEAVYQFQLKEGIITWKEKDKSAYWWFWNATRAKLNSLLQ